METRTLLFLFGCISLRLFFVLVAKNINKNDLPSLGLAALIPAIGFMSIYLGGYRKIGPETFGQPIWWNDLRPIHSMLYFAFSFLAFRKSGDSFKPLLVDVSIGLTAFVFNRMI